MTDSTKKHFLQVAIYFLIVAVFFVLPSGKGLTPEGMRLLGVFIAFIYGLTVTTDVWPALLALFLLPFTGLTDFVGLLKLSFGNDTFFFVLLSLVLVAYMESSGAANYVATVLLKRNFLKGHPWRLMFMFLFICWILSSFVNAVAGMMITWAFLYEIFAQFDYKPFDKEPTLIILGTCIVGGLGLSTLPWGNNSVVILNAFTNTTGIETDFFRYMGFSIPYGIMVICGYLALCKFIFRMDVKRLEEFDPSTLSSDSQQLTTEKMLALISMVALVLMILIPTFLPAENIIVRISKILGLSGKLLLIFAVLQIIHINDAPACNFAKLATKGISWSLTMTIANIMAFSSLIGKDEVGINIFLGNFLAPIFEGKPTVVFVIVVTCITVICTNFMVNKIIAVLMISMTMPIALNLGMNLEALAILYCVACTIAFLLPSASQSACILFSNTTWVRAGDVFKYGLPSIIVATVLILIWDVLYFSIF